MSRGFGDVDHVYVQGVIGNDSRITVALPYLTDDGQPMPFVVTVGWSRKISLHAEREGLTRLRDALTAALDGTPEVQQ